MVKLKICDAHTVEFTPGPRHRNTNSANAVQGGVQALVAERCAEHAMGGGRRMVATDLDVRFLTGLRAPRLVAGAEVVSTDRDGGVCTVALRDGEGAGQIATYATLTMRFVN
jgi:acyl-coenzyme A thioesterase PaaI-like protein